MFTLTSFKLSLNKHKRGKEKLSQKNIYRGIKNKCRGSNDNFWMIKRPNLKPKYATKRKVYKFLACPKTHQFIWNLDRDMTALGNGCEQLKDM